MNSLRAASLPLSQHKHQEMRENERRLMKMIKFNNYDSFQCEFVVVSSIGGSPFTMSAIKKFICPIFTLSLTSCDSQVYVKRFPVHYVHAVEYREEGAKEFNKRLPYVTKIILKILK